MITVLAFLAGLGLAGQAAPAAEIELSMDEAQTCLTTYRVMHRLADEPRLAKVLPDNIKAIRSSDQNFVYREGLAKARMKALSASNLDMENADADAADIAFLLPNMIANEVILGSGRAPTELGIVLVTARECDWQFRLREILAPSPSSQS